MKKLLIVTISLIALPMMAGVKEELKLMRDKLDAIYEVSKTDASKAEELLGKGNLVYRLKYSSSFKALRLEYDKKLGENGLKMNWWDVATFPYMSENERKALGLDKSLAGTVAIAKKYRINITPYGFIKSVKLNPNETVTIWNEFILRLDHISTDWLQIFSSYFAEYADDIAKAHLIKLGNYQKDDEKKYVESYVEAMNKPYYQGINDWLESVGVTNKVIDISTIWKPSDIEKMKSEILKGDFPLTSSFAFRLQVALGLEEYNKFIDEYMKEDN